MLLYDTEHGEFSRHVSKGYEGDTMPLSRQAHSSTLFEDRIYLFGGFSEDSQLWRNDVCFFEPAHVLAGGSVEVCPLEVSGEVPEGRAAHAAELLDGLLWISYL